MKINLHKNDKKPTALSKLLEKIEGYKWADGEDYSKLIAQVKDEPDPSKPDSLPHAGDLQPGQVGVDVNGTTYLGFLSGDSNVTGAYEFDGLHRFFPGSGPEVCVHNISEIHLVEDGAVFPEAIEEHEEPDEDDGEHEALERAARAVIEAYQKRSEKGSAGRLESVITNLEDLLGE